MSWKDESGSLSDVRFVCPSKTLFWNGYCSCILLSSSHGKRLTFIITTNDGFLHLNIVACTSFFYALWIFHPLNLLVGSMSKASPSRLTLYQSHPLDPLIPLDETFKSLTMEIWCTNFIDFPSWLFKASTILGYRCSVWIFQRPSRL